MVSEVDRKIDRRTVLKCECLFLVILGSFLGLVGKTSVHAEAFVLQSFTDFEHLRDRFRDKLSVIGFMQ